MGNDDNHHCDNGGANEENLSPQCRLSSQQTKSCTIIGEKGQVEETRNNFPGFIEGKILNNQKLGKLVQDNDQPCYNK